MLNHCIENDNSRKKTIQEYFRDIAILVYNKVNITIKRVTHIFSFPVHIKVMLMLYCNLLSVQ